LAGILLKEPVDLKFLLESHSGNCNGFVSRRETSVSSSLTSSTIFIKEKNMADPRSKAKAPKTKEAKAPHQQIKQQQAMKSTGPVAPVQKIMRNTGRGR
jgi:hypothetical protein